MDQRSPHRSAGRAKGHAHTARDNSPVGG